MIKRCWIRGDQKEKRCPFGLPITLACQNAGDSVTHMCPLEAVSKEKVERTAVANKRVYLYHKTGERCLYAVNIMDSVEAVNCDFGDVGEGLGGVTFSGSPLYAQNFAGCGLDGLYAFPLGFYADNNTSRNLFHGLFSLLGTFSSSIIRLALDFRNDLWHKLENGEALTAQERQELEQELQIPPKESLGF